MKLQKTILLLIVTFAVSITTVAQMNNNRNVKLYEQMSRAEREVYVRDEARNIARRLSGREYDFTPAFEAEIFNSVRFYANRINNNQADALSKGDARFVFERGRTHAPALIKAFTKQKLSPLYGLYIPLIESEYINISAPNSVGAIGMFQFLPQTGARYGLTTEGLLDVEKSADAAARYIAKSLDEFKDDAMPEALALLSYNRGVPGVKRDLTQIINDENKLCSICALTAARDTLDDTFKKENVFYVPRFFAAAIVGENPAVFGLDGKPLSSYDNAN